MSTPETIPDRASNAGPEAQPLDFDELMWTADEYSKAARHATRGTREQKANIEHAIEALQKALEMRFGWTK
jgi:hypothetical protein